MQASQVLQHQTGRKQKFFIDLALCTGADCHFETGKDLPQTAATDRSEESVHAVGENSPKDRKHVDMSVYMRSFMKMHANEPADKCFEHTYVHTLHVQ